MITRLTLIRHGETQWNAEKRYIGVTDMGLNEKGKAQAGGLATALGSVSSLMIYSSTLKRTKQTAEIIGQACNAQPKVIAGLDEIDFGSWEGLTLDEIQAKHPHLIDGWQDLETDFQMPEGEKWLDFGQRVKKSFNEILADNSGKIIVVVTHAGPIKYILCCLLKISLLNFWKFQIDHGAVTMLEIENGKTTIMLLNDTCHLPTSNVCSESGEIN